MNLSQLLRSQALFGGLDEARLKEVVTCLKRDKFKKNHLVIKEGDMGNRMYLIIQGSVEILKHIPERERQEQLAILKEGDSFGEMELIDIQPRTATVRALEDLETVSLSNADLLKLSQQDLEAFSIIVINIARIISRRLRKMDDEFIPLL